MAQSAIEKIKAIQELWSYQESLAKFTQAAWQYMDPAPLVWNWHHDAICEHIEAVYRGQIHKLAVALPPRHSKSTLISLSAPAWAWTWKPGMKLLCASYGMNLAMRDSQRCRALVDSLWYQKLFGSVFQWLPDQNRLGRFENTKGGYRIATSVSGASTGEGGDIVQCLSLDTCIKTDMGELTIGAIVDKKLPVSVLSYNHSTAKLEYKPIEAYEKNPGRDACKVTCSNGSVIECTKNHPFYVKGKGYIEASRLQRGDVVYETNMRSMRQAVSATQSGGALSPTLLQQGVCKTVGTARDVCKTSLFAMRGICTPYLWGVQDKTKKILQQYMPWSMDKGTYRQFQGSDLQGVRQNIYGKQNKPKCKILYLRLLQRQPSLAHAWARSFALWQGFWDNSAAYTSKRQQSVYAMQGNNTLRGASYRPQQREQWGVQSDYAVSGVSSSGNTLSVGEQKTGLETTTVQSVVSGVHLSTTYNIRVADNHNYFANGILTHNCDDPHNINEAESDLVRRATLAWWDNTMTSRLNDQQTGGMIIIGQRVHEADLIGHVLEQGGWEYLCLPAEYEPSRKTFTSIGWSDPRTEQGQPLWPEKFPLAVLNALRSILQMNYYAQYQQKPVLEEGSIIKSETMLSYIDEGPETYLLHTPDKDKRVLKLLCRRVISTDFAVATSEQADYTVFLDWDITPDGEALLLDITIDKWQGPEAEDKLWTMLRATPRLWCCLIEDVAYQKSIIQRGRRNGFPIRPFLPLKDKVARAQSIAVYFMLGLFFFSQYIHNFPEYKKQLLGFPRTDHKDMVDATSILNELYAHGEPMLTSIELGESRELAAITKIREADPSLADFLEEGLFG